MLPLLLALHAAAVDVDLSERRAQGSARMIGLAGAYRAIAEGAVAQRVNPAAVAIRAPGTDPDEWAWDTVVAASGLVPLLQGFQLQDLVDAPLPTLDLTGGVVVGRRGRAGSVLVDLRSLVDEESGRRSVIVDTALGGGISLVDDTVHIGVIPGISVVSTRPADEGLTAVLPTLGAGVRWDVADAPVRLGLSGRTPWRTRVSDAPVDAVRVPWELGAGVALHRGRMSRGPTPEGGDDRTPVFVQWAFDAALVGAQADTTSLEAWTRGQPRPASTEPTVTLATGVEAEPWRRHLRVRAGLYTEPARLRLDRVRVHGTLGLDLALFEAPRGRFRWMLAPTVDASGAGIQPTLGVGVW